jgi:lysozyme
MANISPTPEKPVETISDAVIFSRIIAKNFLSIPRIAEDMSIIRRNIQNMVKMRGGKAIRSADSNFMSSSKAENELKDESQSTRAKSVTPEKEEIGLGKAVMAGALAKTLGVKKSFKLMNVVLKIRKLFSLGNLIKVVGKLGLPLMIFSALYDGFTAAFDKWKETGSIWETFKAGIGGVVEWLTFGLIDKQMVSDFYDWSLGAIEKVMQSVANFFGFGEVFTEQFAKVKKFLGVAIQPKNQPQAPSIDKPKESETKKELSKQEVQKLEKEKQYTGKDEIVRKRIGLPEKPASEMEPTPTAPAATKTQPSIILGPQKEQKEKTTTTAPVTKISGMEDVKSMVIRHEGIRMEPYKDSLGLWTVGVGHLIGDGKSLPPEWNRKFSKDEVMKLFEEDFAHHAKLAEQTPGYSKANEAGKGAFIDLTFNMGKWWPKWPSTRTKLEAGDFKGAAEGLQDSKWYQQVKGRAVTIVNLVAQAGGKENSGSSIAAASSDVASSQRQQAKPSAPVVVNNTTVNNNNSSRTQLASTPKDNNSTNSALLARAT